MIDEVKKTDLWEKYEACKKFHEELGTFSKAETNYRMFNGDQWHGITTPDGEKPPSVNIVKPIVLYKTSVVAQQGMIPVYSSNNKDSVSRFNQVSAALTNWARRWWEICKLDVVLWDCFQDACIASDAFLYVKYDKEKESVSVEQLESTNVFFADEQEKDIQRQDLVIISQRLTINKIKRIAKQNGITDLSDIVADTDTQLEIGDKAKKEVKTEQGKATLLTGFYKEDDKIYMTQSVRSTIIMKPAHMVGMNYYPIAHFVWEEEKGYSRGVGVVQQLIANQIIINKSYARLDMAIRMSAYPHIAYDSKKIDKTTVANFGKVGASIGFDGLNSEPISNVIQYVQPAGINTMAYNFPADLATITKNQASAGDSATGVANPEQASGTAILAVQNAAQLPLNPQMSRGGQFGEDIARIFYDTFVAYHPEGAVLPELDENGDPIIDQIPQTDENGNLVPDEQGQPIILAEKIRMVTISQEELSNLDVDIKVDISSKTPYSIYSQDSILMKIYEMGGMSLEQLAEAASDEGGIPKEKLKNLVADQIAALTEQLQQAIQMIKEQQAQVAQGQQAIQLLQEQDQINQSQKTLTQTAQGITEMANQRGNVTPEEAAFELANSTV